MAEGLSKVVTSGQRILLIVPDMTRTAPVSDLVRLALPILRDLGVQVDIMVALGTHPPLPQETLRHHVGLGDEPWRTSFNDVKLMNHAWDDPSQLQEVATLPDDRIRELSNGLMSENVVITLNKTALKYDQLLILGPVFPHEIAGFSGGSKYLFPGISGPEIIDFFHWLGAVITNLKLIGIIDNPVRRVLDEAAAQVPIPTSAISFVVHDGEVVHMTIGPLQESWRSAAKHSLQCHVVYKPRKYQRVLACAPAMYEDLWTGGKCMYKAEPVIEDNGELIIYAPHIFSPSLVHESVLRRIGYHVRDYYLKRLELFADIPRAVMAVSTYIKGTGTYIDGIEKPRIQVSVASQIPRELIETLGLGYIDPDTINVEDWRNREEEGLLLIERAGETLYLPAQSDTPA